MPQVVIRLCATVAGCMLQNGHDLLILAWTGASSVNVLFVGGLILAAASQQAPAVGSAGTSHAFWVGVLVALLVARVLPGWAGIALFVIALFALHIFQSIIGHAHSSSSSSTVLLLLLIVVGVLALIVGLIVGRSRGLRQLGEVEFRTRLRNVRGVSRW
jgi:uncharacterized membrane protein